MATLAPIAAKLTLNMLRSSLRLVLWAGLSTVFGCKGTIGAGPPVSVSLSPQSPTVVINGTRQFTATVQNDVENKGVAWQVNGVTGGAAATGTVNSSGLFTAPSAVPAGGTVTVAAVANADLTKSAQTTVTIVGLMGPVSVTLTPTRAALAASQTLAFNATVTNDVGGQGVIWSASAGTFTAMAPGSATYKAPATGGNFTVTATSVLEGTKSASASIAVTDIGNVPTWRYDNTRSGANTKEYALTTSNVAPGTFGKVSSCPVDAPMYAEPLWVPNLVIGGGTRNVIFAATVHDTVYAFDADAKTCVTYWQKSLLGANETWVDYNDVGSTDIDPDIGIVGTPVIDPASATIYVLAKSEVTGSACSPASSCHQRLHALSLPTGAEKFGGPVEISATVSGNGDGSTTVLFNPLTQNQRPGLTLVNGVVYVAWASHGDNTPYHGWIIGYDAATLQQTTVFNATPNGGLGGIWQSGNGLAVDASGVIYCVTGNGSFDTTASIPPVSPNNDYGSAALRITTTGGLTLTDFFTPLDFSTLNGNDTDLGAGGVVILPDQTAGGSVPVHLLFFTAKSGKIYLLNRDDMGRFSSATDMVEQEFVASGGGFWSTPAFWENTAYACGSGDTLQAWPFSHTTPGQFDAASTSASTENFGFPGANPTVSSAGSSNGIVWAIDTSQYGTPAQANPGPAVLYAYDATNLGNELWNSSQSANDQAGDAVKFTVPNVVNGRVYIGTRSELDVYGLLSE
jgi:hypothetical protein